MAINQLEATKYLYTGIFADEKVLQFLELLQNLGDQCLQELHQVAIDKVYGGKPAHLLLPSELNPTSAYGMAFQTGLLTIRNWGTEVLQQEVDRLRKQCPYIDDLYRYTVARYLQEIYRHERPQTISIDVPALREFLHQFYIQLGSNPLTKNLKYFTTFGVEKKSLMMDSIRLALFRLLEKQIDFQTTATPLGQQHPSLSSSSSSRPPLRPWYQTTSDNPRTPQIPPTPVPPTPTPAQPKTPRRESKPHVAKKATPSPSLDEMLEEMKLATRQKPISSSKREASPPSPPPPPKSSHKRDSSGKPQQKPERLPSPPHLATPLPSGSGGREARKKKETAAAVPETIPEIPLLSNAEPDTSDLQTRTINIDVEKVEQTLPIPSTKSARSARKKPEKTQLFDEDLDQDESKK